MRLSHVRLSLVLLNLRRLWEVPVIHSPCPFPPQCPAKVDEEEGHRVRLQSQLVPSGNSTFFVLDTISRPSPSSPAAQCIMPWHDQLSTQGRLCSAPARASSLSTAGNRGCVYLRAVTLNGGRGVGVGVGMEVIDEGMAHELRELRMRSETSTSAWMRRGGWNRLACSRQKFFVKGSVKG